MATDLTKMAEDWYGSNVNFYRLLLSMAAEIKDNRKEIERLKTDLSNYESHISKYDFKRVYLEKRLDKIESKINLATPEPESGEKE